MSATLRTPTGAALLALASGLVLATASPAAADLTVSLEGLRLPSVVYAHQAQTVSGRVVLTTVDTTDPSAPSGGWQVTTQATALTYRGTGRGADLPAAHLVIHSLEAPTVVEPPSGEGDAVGGPQLPEVNTPGSPDTPRTVLEAQPGQGHGAYAQEITLSPALPPGARPGTCSGIITTTISPTPARTTDSSAEPTTPPPQPAPPLNPRQPVCPR